MNRFVSVLVFLFAVSLMMVAAPSSVYARALNPDYAKCMRLPPVEINVPGTPAFGFAWRGKVPTETQLGAYFNACAAALDTHPNDAELLRRLAVLASWRFTAARRAFLVLAELPRTFSMCSKNASIRAASNCSSTRADGDVLYRSAAKQSSSWNE